MDFDAVRSARKPHNRTAWVPLDGELLDEIAALERIVAEAERLDGVEHRKAQAPALKRKLEALREKAAGAAVQFTFREISRREYRALLLAHPATDEDRARGIEAWHEDSFAPALMAASAVDPAMTFDEAREVWDEWPTQVAYTLFGTAVAASEGDSSVPFSVIATAAMPGSPPNSTSASEMAEQ